jgi:hypothetical protein
MIFNWFDSDQESYRVWWSRLWTLQEAVFVKELHFRFQDRALDGRDLVERSGNSYNMFHEVGWTAAEQIAYEGLAYLRELYTFKYIALDSRAVFIL